MNPGFPSSTWASDFGTLCLKKSLELLRLTVKQKRDVIEQASAEYDVGLLCELLDLQRSSFYYTSKAVDDSHLRKAIEEICLKQTRYGYRRIIPLATRNASILSPISCGLDGDYPIWAD